MLDFRICNDDILKAWADIVALKYAERFHGADLAIATAVGFSAAVDEGQHIFVKGSNIDAREVLFVGVGPLGEFRYQKIRKFGQHVLETVARERPRAESLAMTMHGPGYGLDEKEAFLSLMSGLRAAKISSSQLRTVSIFERNSTRATRLEQLLQTISDDDSLAPEKRSDTEPTGSNILSLADYGTKSEDKPRLFIAMPFSEKYLDEYDIAFTEAAHKNGFVCERLDVESFVGDVVSEIKKRILNSTAILALLNDQNPNVFLEIGFAMAHGKPIVLVVKEGTTVPFDVRGQRYLEYTRIHVLREVLTTELAKLKRSGVFTSLGKAI